MSKSKNRDTKNPATERAAGQGEVNHQRRTDSQQQAHGREDHSEGSQIEGQHTARHGQGAGFSRNVH